MSQKELDHGCISFALAMIATTAQLKGVEVQGMRLLQM